MLKIRLRLSLRMMFVAVSVVAVLVGGLVWFVMFLSRIPPGVELVSEITPSALGDRVACVTYHGGYDDKWTGVRNFIARYTGHNTYPESVRLVLLDTSNDKTLDLGAGELAGSLIAWTADDSLLAYVSGELRPDNRKRLEFYNLSSESSETVFVGSDWYVHSLCFSPDDKYLAFVENYNQKNLTTLDVDKRSTTILASGVNGNCLKWSVDGNSVFCIRNGLEIWQLGVNKRSKRLLFRGKDLDENYPYFLVPSPDGRRLGFGYARGFCSLDLATNKVEKWFDCDHYFVTFDWSNEGICYLDAAGRERMKKARVMIYDPNTRTKEELAVGPFAHVAWLRKGVLIVRRNNAELWELTIRDKSMKKLFPSEPW